jgi:hypothetical protein
MIPEAAVEPDKPIRFRNDEKSDGCLRDVVRHVRPLSRYPEGAANLAVTRLPTR